MTQAADSGTTPDLLAELAARVDSAAAGSLTPYEFPAAFGLTDEEREGPAAVAVMAFEYMEGGARGRDDPSYFGPMMEFQGKRYPPALADVRTADAELWVALAGIVSSPLARARLNDLCFEGRWGHGGEQGAAAIDAYLEISALDVYALDDERRTGVAVGRVDWLTRALDLARKMRDERRVEQTVAAIVGAAKESLAQHSHEPGVALGLIEALVDANRHEADGLLGEARLRYAGDAFNTAETIALQLKRVSDDAPLRSELRRQLVTTWMVHARTTEPLVRMHFLEVAVKLARDFGLSELVDEITADLQAIQPEDLDLKSHAYEIQLPTEAVEQYIDQFTDSETWEAALLRLCAAPPSGVTAMNRETADGLAIQAPLSSLFPEVLLGGDGLPRFTVASEEDKREKRLADVERSSMRIHGYVINETLARIWEKWGPIDAEALAAFLGANAHVRPSLAEALARAFVRFFAGDTEAALFTATPRIEALVRDLVLAGGLPIYRTQRAKSPGQYPGLGALLPALLEAGVDESWIRFLNTLLANPMGENARNELLHGFYDDPPEILAALVLVGVIFLTRGIDVGDSAT